MIEAIEALYRPDVYEYQIDLVRQKGQWGTVLAEPSAAKAVLAGE